MEILESLKADFNHQIAFREKMPGVFQIVPPLFHEDGDMVDIFLDLPTSEKSSVRISDHGLTLMRLSYSYNIDTPSKQKVLHRILSENGVSEERGRFYIETRPEHLYPALLQFAQTVAKVSNMQVSREKSSKICFTRLWTISCRARSAVIRRSKTMPRYRTETIWRSTGSSV